MSIFDEADDPDQHPWRYDEFWRRWIQNGYTDDEVLGETPHISAWTPAGIRQGKIRIAALRRQMTDARPVEAGGPSAPIATREQAHEAYQEHGSDRKAARALGISRTQLRRLRGVEK